jgi:hypothetical protein
VHEGGFHLRRDAQGDLYFLTPRGKAIPACGRYETLDIGDATAPEGFPRKQSACMQKQMFRAGKR